MNDGMPMKGSHQKAGMPSAPEVIDPNKGVKKLPQQKGAES